MFRRWLSTFWRNNKQTITRLAKLFAILIVISISAGAIFSNINNSTTEENEVQEIYRPHEVAISGGEIAEEKFENENTVVKKFVEFCNVQNSTEAYNLLTDECKEMLYPTIKDFEDKYCKIIFSKKREYNLQAWIAEQNYSTYRIRFTEDFMESGSYDETEKFEDYITIVTDSKNQENKKINVNGYIKTVQINKKTETENLKMEVLSVDVYMDYAIYNMNFENKTDSDILLDTLETYDNIKLIGSNGATYKLDSMNLKVFDLRIARNSKKEVMLRFRKTHGSNVSGNSILFNRVIMDYFEYTKDRKNYDNFEDLTIKL